MSKSDNRDTVMALCGVGLAVVALNKFVIPWWVKKFPPKVAPVVTTTGSSNSQSS